MNKQNDVLFTERVKQGFGLFAALLIVYLGGAVRIWKDNIYTEIRVNNVNNKLILYAHGNILTTLSES